MTPELSYLIELADNLNVGDIAGLILYDPRFDIWSGSHKPHFHHYGKGGLVKHTAEVVKLAFASIQTLKLDVDRNEVYLSALFHDVGKMYDYIATDDTYTSWLETPHKRLIHHITRSALIWHDSNMTFGEKYGHLYEPVLHNILAHHGQREWGSPVAPKSQVAWLIHLADGISARMNDWNKMDIVKHEKQ